MNGRLHEYRLVIVRNDGRRYVRLYQYEADARRALTLLNRYRWAGDTITYSRRTVGPWREQTGGTR